MQNTGLNLQLSSSRQSDQWNGAGGARLGVTGTALPTDGWPRNKPRELRAGATRGGGGGRSGPCRPWIFALASVSGAYDTSVWKPGLSSQPMEYHQDWRQQPYAPGHIGAGVLAMAGSTRLSVFARRRLSAGPENVSPLVLSP